MMLFLTLIFAPAAAGTPAANATITDAVAASSGEQTVVVRFSDPAQLPAGAADAAPVGQLQMKAASSQDRFDQFAANNPHVEIEDSFWIANAKLVTVDTAQVPLQRLADVENVRMIHRDFKVSTRDIQISGSETENYKQVSTSETEYTWGVKEIQAPKTWQQFENQGDNVSVAVLDTGVNASHPDIEVAKWKDFEDSSGGDGDDDSPSATPKDYGPLDHGTHVSGTVVGGDASGRHIGVAPNASLYVGAVLTNSGFGSFSNIVNGMEWAVAQDADVLSMSLGGETEDFESASNWIDPIQNVRQAGTIPVVAIGNNGEGTSGAPGNVYGSISVGASTQSGDIASLSSGETIETSDWYDPWVPNYWPSSYVVPDISAPGKSVYSSYSDDEYVYKSGTSMATPHASGGIALMLSNGNGDVTPTRAQTLLEDTAVDLGTEETRQGAGQIDIYNATLQHSWTTLQPTLSPNTANVSIPTELTVDANHPIATYHWTLPNGSTVSTADATLTYSFEQRTDAAPVEVTLQDIRGENRTESITVDVGDAIAPTANVDRNRSTVEVGIETVQFNASRSTDNDRIDHYDWNFGDGTRRTTTDPIVNHTYTNLTNGSPKLQTLTLNVTDAVENSNTTTTDVEIVDTIKPTPRVTVSESTVVGDQIIFDATQSTDNGNITEFNWDFEDGTTKSGKTISHRFETTGSKTVSLTTVDGGGNTNTTETTVTVTSVPAVTVTEPSDRSYLNTENISVQYSLSGTAVSEAAGMEYQITTTNGGEQVTDWQAANFTNTTDPVSNSTTVGPLEDGNYTIEFRIIGQDGTALPYTAATTNVTVSIKTTPPDTTLAVSPVATGFEAIGPNNPVRIDASVSDPLSSTTMLTVTDPTDKNVLSWDLSEATGDGTSVTRIWNGTDESEETVANGQYVINLTAVDEIGNTINTTESVTVDTTNPTVTFSSITGGKVSDGTRYINDSTTADIELAADSNGEGQAPVTAVTADAVAERVNYRVTPTISQTVADELRWTGQLDGSTIEESGDYTLTVTATDSANNTKTTKRQLKYDPTPPDLSAVITNVDSNNDQATVSVRSNEPLSSAPTVQLAAPGSETRTINLNPEESRWRGTFNLAESGQYTLTATGIDRAGNRGTDQATTTISSEVTTENRTAFVYDESSGLFIRVNTTRPVDNRVVALSGTSVSPEVLADNQFGVQFLEGALDTTISDNLANATVGIPVTTNALPDGIAPTSDQIQIEHYDNGWNTKSTSVRNINELDGRISGQYWTTTVDSFSSYGVTITDTNPPELDDTTATLADGEQTVTLTASYSDDLSGINASAVTLSVDGTDLTEAKNTSITSSNAKITNYPVNDDQYELGITVEDTAGNTDQYERTIAADQPDDTSPRSLDDDGGSGGGSGGGAGGAGGADDGAGDDAPPTVQEVRSTLSLVQADSDVSTEIADDNPDTPGLSVSPQGTQFVRSINFNNEELAGSVSIREYNNPPEQVAAEVSASISNDVSTLSDSDVTVVSVSDIVVDTESDDTSATIQKTVPQDRVTDPDQLTVVKESYDFEAQADRWGQLDTEVVETTDEEVVVEAPIEKFSLFVVAEVAKTTGDGMEDDSAENDSIDDGADDRGTDDGIPGFGAAAALIALIGTVLYARRQA